jgi:hypothetical protein
MSPVQLSRFALVPKGSAHSSNISSLLIKKQVGLNNKVEPTSNICYSASRKDSVFSDSSSEEEEES